MAATVTFLMYTGDTPTQYSKSFYVGENPSKAWKGIKCKNIESIVLSGDELAYAKTNLGAADVKKSTVMYYGDEACRIFFNW